MDIIRKHSCIELLICMEIDPEMPTPISMEEYKNLIKQLPVEQQLSIEQDQFRGAFESAAIGMAIVGPDGKWLNVNDSLLHIFGYSKDELYRLTFQDITYHDDLEADLTLVKQLLEGNKNSYRMEKRYYHKNGDIIWTILSVSIVRDILGVPLHFVSQITDITEIKKITHMRLAESDKQSSRIALELHENIAQTLESIKMYLNSSLSAQMYKDRNLQGVDQQLCTLISEIKSLTANIMPTTFLEANLRVVIGDLVLKYHIQHNLQIDVSLDDSFGKIDFNSSYHIFRIIENHLKLAVFQNATVLRLSISGPKMPAIKIDSDGKPSQLFASQEKLLLSDIKTRAEMLNGAITYNDYKNGVQRPHMAESAS